jgi:DNA-binding IclR family transcriptional regulator
MTKTGVDAVGRALAILRTFGPERPEMTLTEIAEQTDLYKSTVLRLAASLEAGGFLTRGSDRVYRPGPELWRLGSLYRRSLDVGEVIRPALQRLVEATTETASFYIRDGDDRICLYRVNSPRAVRHHLDEGQRLPLNSGAAGHILGAYGSQKWPNRKKILAEGYYVSEGERDPEVAAAAVPVIDNQGKLRGALSVSGTISRFDARAQKKAIAALQSEARALAAALPARA